MTEHKCDQCDKKFGGQEGLDQHKRDKHGMKLEGKKSEHKSSSSSLVKYVVIFVVILIIIGLGVFFVMSQSQSNKNPAPTYNRELPKIGFHWHPKLNIYINDELVIIPTDIGLQGAVHQPIHTHDTDNILHYEFDSAPTYEQIRLGNFFRIWGKTFNKNCIFEYCNGHNGTVKFYVNGVENNYYDDYIPYDLELLEIKYE